MLPPLRVLVLDENPDTGMVLAWALEAPDVCTQTVENLAEALIALETFAPDVIIAEVVVEGRHDKRMISTLHERAINLGMLQPRMIVHTRDGLAEHDQLVDAHFVKPTPVSSLRCALRPVRNLDNIVN